jgi:hypothetical protein
LRAKSEEKDKDLTTESTETEAQRARRNWEKAEPSRCLSNGRQARDDHVAASAETRPKKAQK